MLFTRLPAAHSAGARWMVQASKNQNLVRAVTPNPAANYAVSSGKRFFGVSLDHMKQLRSQSGAPMIECKKALDETGGNDIAKAMDWLREHGVAKASSKLKGREAAEGLIGVKIAEDGASASLVKVSSETDFASRSPAFVSLVSTAVDAALGSNGGDAAGVLDTATLGPSVKEALDEAILAIRENMSVSRAMKFASLEGKYVGYIHGRIDGSEVAGTSAAIVHVAPNSDKEVPGDVMEQVGKKLAMHVVAAKPLYLSPEDVPEEEVEKERTILMQQVADSGKPDNIIEKIVSGKMRKYYEGICLTEQAHMVEEGNPKVSNILNELGLKVTKFEALSIS